jgi:hypothetical protein
LSARPALRGRFSVFRLDTTLTSGNNTGISYRIYLSSHTNNSGFGNIRLTM